jgi:tRNA(fMet)-specific endonuclease VapC
VTYLLDTDICVEYLRGSDADIRDRLSSLAPTDAWLCSIVKAELNFGAHNSKRVAANLRRLREFYQHLQSAPFDDRAAEHYGSLRAHLRREGTEIGPNDLKIASIALANDMTLVTGNLREFHRVPGLMVAEW